MLLVTSSIRDWLLLMGRGRFGTSGYVLGAAGTITDATTLGIGSPLAPLQGDYTLFLDSYSVNGVTVGDSVTIQASDGSQFAEYVPIAGASNIGLFVRGPVRFVAVKAAAGDITFKWISIAEKAYKDLLQHLSDGVGKALDEIKEPTT